MKRSRFTEDQIIAVFSETNAKPKRIVADQMLDLTAMKELLANNW